MIKQSSEDGKDEKDVTGQSVSELILDAEAGSELARGKKALFLDRDGVINVEKHYLYLARDFEFCPGIIELCLRAQEKGYEIVVVTNQSGVARGYYTEDDFWALTQHMKALFEGEGVQIRDVFFCPYLEHEDRKPLPGMFLKAQAKWGFEMSSSVCVGDKARDLQAGQAAGVGRNILLSESLAEQEKAPEGTLFIKDLREACSYL